MEIMNEKHKKRTIILVTENSNEEKYLKNILSKNYDTITVKCSDFSKEYLNSTDKQFSVILIDFKKAFENDFEILKSISEDNLFADIALLVYCENAEELNNSVECLKYGASDILSKIAPPEAILNRIANSIKLKKFSTFYEIENILKELPSNIYMKDAEGKYIFATHYWHHIHRRNEMGWTIRGKTDIEIRKDKSNALKAFETDKKIIETGKGMTYTIEVNEDGKREFLELIKQPYFDEDGKVAGIIALINDVTDRELLRISLEESAMMDELTHVYNRRFFDQYTSNLIKHGSFPFSIISADCNDLKKVNDTYGHIAGDEYIRIAALLFRMNVEGMGTIFRTGGDEFVIIIPNDTDGKAEEIIQKLKDEEKHFSIKNKNISISYGLSYVKGENDDFKTALNEADKKMYENKAAYKKSIQDE